MNRVVHFEINVPDPQAVLGFYADVFGWEIGKWEGPIDYWLVTTGEESEQGINGGIMRSPDGQPRVVNVIEVQSIDEFTDKVTESGGRVIVPKMPVPGVGHVAYFADPGGAIFGIMHSDPSIK